MSYTINLTDGTQLTQLVDGTIDQTTTDLTLIGKNATGYGIYFNDNFVYLLENFANTTQPPNALTGQVWYDTTQNVLKVYNGSSFVNIGGAQVSATVPSNLTTGDFWIDSANAQLYFNDGISNVLAGPLYTSTQGLSGFQVETILDSNNLSHTIVYLYVSATLIGIFSSSSFTPATSISGFTGNINVGFNASNLAGLTFNAPVETASQLLAADGVTLYTVEDFVKTTDSSSIDGTLTITNATPLILGINGNNEINISSTLFQIASNTANQNFEISTLSGSTLSPSLYINASSKNVGIFNNNPQYTLDVAGPVHSTGAGTFGGSVTATTLIETTSYTPPTSSSAGTTGQIAWDSSYVYVCIATNTWKRAALSTW
jgi:hypothetical protein